MVNWATTKATTPARRNIQGWTLVRKEKLWSHLIIIKYATGTAIRKATATSFAKSLDIRTTIFEAADPSTLRIPTSLAESLLVLGSGLITRMSVEMEVGKFPYPRTRPDANVR